jgi:hypothetical protein
MRAHAIVATMIAPAIAMVFSPTSNGYDDTGEPIRSMIAATAAGTANKSAIVAPTGVDRNVLKAICPARRTMTLTIAPTAIAAFGPELVR